MSFGFRGLNYLIQIIYMVFVIQLILLADGILRKLVFKPVILVTQGVILLVNMVGLKMLLGKALKVEDDVSICVDTVSCVHICSCVLVCVHIYLCSHVCTYVVVCSCVHMYLCAHVNICSCVPMCVHWSCVHAYVSIELCTF